MKKKTIITLIIILQALIFTVSVSSQRIKDLIKIEPRPCEFSNQRLEQADDEAGQDSIIILISKLGVKDTKKDIAKKRLHTAKAYLTKYRGLRGFDAVLIAEAPKEKKLYYGGVEIYVKGKFFDILTSSPNGVLALGACDYPDAQDAESRERDSILYPWLYKKKVN